MQIIVSLLVFAATFALVLGVASFLRPRVAGRPAREAGAAQQRRQFRLKPPGRHLIRLCKGTACHVVGAEMIARTVADELGVSPDESTDDGLFTFTVVACLGCCSLAPVLMIDDQTYGRLTPQKVRKLLRQPYFVPESKPAADLFHTFRRKKICMALETRVPT